MTKRDWKLDAAQKSGSARNVAYGLLALLLTLTSALPATASAWTEGHKNILFIRVDFSDLPGEPITQAAAESLINNVANPAYVENSYNKTSLSVTVTPTYRLPQTAAYYASKDAFGNDRAPKLRDDARAKATAGGYVLTNYKLDIFAFAYIPAYSFAGRATVGNKGLWINGNYDFRTIVHELGHNYGLRHSNLWKTTNGTVIGSGSSEAYGDVFDIMGANWNNDSNLHFNAWSKNLMNWMTNVQTVTTTGIYRIYAQDFGTMTGMQGIKVKKDTSKNYWIEFRRKLTNSPYASNGALVHWGYNSVAESNLLDMTPNSAGAANDAPLAIGTTFTDTTVATPISFMPIAKGGSSPEWMDIKIKFGANKLPTATSASVTTPEDTAKTVTLTGTDLDTVDTLSFKITVLPTQGTLSSDSDGSGPNVPHVITAGELPYSLPANNNAIYTPAANYFGGDTFKFKANDGAVDSSEATITITVSSVNDTPDAVDDNAIVAQASGANAIDVLANDTDADGNTRTITAVTQGAGGSVTITGGGTGLTYTPDPNAIGSDSFTYTISDGHGGVDTATVWITIS